MLDPLIRRRLDPLLDRLGARLARTGVTADTVTLAGLALGLAAAASIAGLVLLLLGRLADGLDGAVARATRPTPYGSYLDICADFAVYAAVPLAFVIVDPAANGAAGAFLLASFYVNGATFLGFAILAEKRALAPDRAAKGFHHSRGLLEGTETIAFFVLLCLLPQHFAALATAFGALCLLTALQRLLHARRVFADAR